MAEPFSILIDDARYTVPTLMLVVETDLGRAKELALRKLRESPQHLSIELFQGDRLIFKFEQDEKMPA